MSKAMQAIGTTLVLAAAAAFLSLGVYSLLTGSLVAGLLCVVASMSLAVFVLVPADE